jgi:hypothetical protein
MTLCQQSNLLLITPTASGKINVSQPLPQKKVLLTHLDWNLQRLDEALKQEATDYYKGAALQRFGHTYTMAMKSIRGFGEPADSEEPDDEQCVALAEQNGWTEGQPEWKEMITDFQRISQKPGAEETEAVYQKLPCYQKAFKNLYSHLKNSL